MSQVSLQNRMEIGMSEKFRSWNVSDAHPCMRCSLHMDAGMDVGYSDEKWMHLEVASHSSDWHLMRRKDNGYDCGALR